MTILHKQKSNRICTFIIVFKDHIKAWEKAKVVAARENLGVPRFYVRYLAELEDFVNEQWKDQNARKTMSKHNSKALSTLRQKVTKYNIEFEEQLEYYRQEPDALGYSSGAAEDDEPDVEVLISFKIHIYKKKYLRHQKPRKYPPKTMLRLTANQKVKSPNSRAQTQAHQRVVSDDDESAWGSESDKSSHVTSSATASDLEPRRKKDGGINSYLFFRFRKLTFYLPKTH
jgi:hypothetical protein